MKIWKNIGMAIKAKSGAYLLPDDPALLPIYEAIQAADRTLIAHLAEPDGGWLPLDAKNPELRYYSANPRWHMYGKPGAPVKADILEARDRVLARYPEAAGRRLPPRERRGRPDPAGEAARRLPQLRGRHRRPRPLPRRGRPGPGPRVPDPVPGPRPVRHRLRAPRRDPAAAARSLRETHDRDWAFFSGGDAMEYDGRPTRGLALPEAVLRKIFRENALRWIPGLSA